MENDLNSSSYYAPPPMTAEDAEDELVFLAVNLARERLIDKSASNQLVAEIIRLGTAKERLQKEKLQKENELLKAKTDALVYNKANEQFYAKVLSAMHEYAPHIYSSSDYGSGDDYDEYDE